MPIPFRDADEVDALGAAAYLKIESDESGGTHQGALFLINARGEPLEFAYNRVETPDTFLWRRADLRRHAERRLVTSLLTVCGRVPRVLFCAADEVGSELFCQDIALDLPVCRIGRALRAVSFTAVEVEEAKDEPEPLHLFWFPAPPAAGAPERQLVERLIAAGLLLEPFERAATGLREVYGEAP